MASSQNVLAEIVAHKLKELVERKAICPENHLAKQILCGNGRFEQALAGDGIKLICEIKPSSPSAGVLRKSVNIDEILKVYDKYACAISCLTDKKYFGGSLELLSTVVQKSKCPVLCKDFVVDAYQVYEARTAGADAVLLIVKILTDEQLQKLYRLIGDLGMTAVVEIQNERELERAMSLTPLVLLINNRNLDTLQIDLETTKQLAPKIPKEVIIVSASGIECRNDIDKLLPFAQRFLIGSVLMAAEDMDAKLMELRGNA
jgi:indole-3-glycerol phosphate synthase